jgi:hypothetical protein
MPTHFKINKRLLTDEEKYSRAIFYYTYDNLDFDVVYKDEENPFDEYGQPSLDIKANLAKLDELTLSLIEDFVKKDVYDRTIDLKCENCGYEENNDWDVIAEDFDERENEYPILYCPHCNKPKFIPLSVYNEKHK